MYSQRLFQFQLNFLLNFILSLGFGYWFAQQQMGAVSANSIQIYPLSFLLLTILKVALTLMVIYTASCFVLRHLTHKKISYYLITASYLPLLLVYFNLSLFNIACAIILLQLIASIYSLNLSDVDRLKKLFAIDILVLFLFFIYHLIFSTRFSPLNWDVATFVNQGFVAEEIPVVATLFKGFALAKQFDFSSFDLTEWAGILNPSITLHSPLLQFITLIFDIPSISPEHYHLVLSAINFILIVGGSFGFYLFLKYSLRIHLCFAFLGGILFFASGAPYLLNMLGNDGGVFLSSYAIFPFALLFISMAFQLKSRLYAAFAGIALSSQFFLIAPHPEGAIFSFLFFGLFMLGLLLFTRNDVFRQKFYLSFITILSTVLLSSFVLIPILYDEMARNMHTFAHISDIKAIDLKAFNAYIKLAEIFIPLSVITLSFQKRITATIMALIFYTLGLLVFIYLISQLWFLYYLLKKLHISIHFWVPWRVGMYFCIGVFAVTMMTFDAYYRWLKMIVANTTSRLRLLMNYE